MKRPIVVIAVVVLVALAALTIRSTVAPDTVRAEIESRLARWLDRPLVLAGAAELTLLPRPALRWTRATLAADDRAAPFARADEIVAVLSPAGLLLGRAEIAALTVRRPDLRLDVLGPSALAGWRTRAATLPALDLTVEGGRLSLAGRDGHTEVIEAVDLTLQWPHGNSRADLEVTARWHDALFTLAVGGPSPDDLVAGRPSRVAVDLRAPHFGGRWSGMLTAADDLRLDGTLSATLADPPRFFDWLDLRSLRGLFLGAVALDGRLAVDGPTATLADARLDLAGSRATGVLSLGLAGPEPQLGATLAFDTVDLHAESGRPFGDGWRALALDRDRLPLALDLRLSARRLLHPRFALDRLAAALHLAGGRLAAEIGEATIWDKPLTLSLRGTLADRGLAAEVWAEARDLPADRLAGLFGISGVEGGLVGLAVEGTAECARLGDCLAALETRSRLVGRDLAVTGAAPFGDVTRFHPIVVAPKGLTRRSNWSRADVSFRTRGSQATFDAVELTGDTARFALAGTGDLDGSRLDLAGRALFPHFRPEAARNGSDGIAIPIRVRGPIGALETTVGHPETPPPAVIEEPAPAPVSAPPSAPASPPTAEPPAATLAPADAVAPPAAEAAAPAPAQPPAIVEADPPPADAGATPPSSN